MNNINWRGIMTIIRKDLMVVLRNKMIMMPIVIVTLVMLVILPIGFGAMGLFANPETMMDDLDMQELFDLMPEAMADQFAGMDAQQIWIVYSMMYMLSPMFLIVPMMTTSVITTDSFAGEKERKTIEALVYTPLTNAELLIGKLLTGWLAAMGVTLAGFLLYSIVANGMGYSIMGRIFFPNLMWVLMVFWMAPGAAAIALGVNVLISVRAKTFQEAYQMSGLIVLPVVALMLGQTAGLLYFSPLFVVAAGAICWLIAGLLIAIGVEFFKRERLLTND